MNPERVAESGSIKSCSPSRTLARYWRGGHGEELVEKQLYAEVGQGAAEVDRGLTAGRNFGRLK